MNATAATKTAAEEIVQSFERGQLSRRQLVAQLMAIGAASAGFASLASAAEPATKPSTFAAATIDHLALSVTDIKRSVAFYQKHLGLKLTRGGGDADGSAFLNCGERDFLALFRGDKPGTPHLARGSGGRQRRSPPGQGHDASRRLHE
jgi:hypothetical protein